MKYAEYDHITGIIKRVINVPENEIDLYGVYYINVEDIDVNTSNYYINLSTLQLVEIPLSPGPDYSFDFQAKTWLVNDISAVRQKYLQLLDERTKETINSVYSIEDQLNLNLRLTLLFNNTQRTASEQNEYESILNSIAWIAIVRESADLVKIIINNSTNVNDIAMAVDDAFLMI